MEKRKSPLLRWTEEKERRRVLEFAALRDCERVWPAERREPSVIYPCHRGPHQGRNLSFPGSQPPTCAPAILPPLLAKVALQLLFLPPDQEVYEREMNEGYDNRGRRSEQQCRSEKNEHVAAEVERIPRKAVGAGSNQRPLRRQRDHPHPVLVEMESRPHAQQEAGEQQCAASHGRGGRPKVMKPGEPIDVAADQPNSETDDYDADVVQNAFG